MNASEPVSYYDGFLLLLLFMLRPILTALPRSNPRRNFPAKPTTIISVFAKSISTTSMATPYHIQVSAKNTGLLKYDQSEETAATTSELLQRDLEVRCAL